MKSKIPNKNNKLPLLFLIFMILFITNIIIPKFGDVSLTQRMWFIMDILVFLVAAFILIKNKLPQKLHIVIALTLSLLMFIAYKGLNISSIKGFITVLLCATASFRVFEIYPNNAVTIIKRKSISTIVVSVALGIAIGVIWGIGNLFLSGQSLHFSLTAACVFTALSPGILEEVCYRLFPFAFCLYFLKGEIKTKSDDFWSYFVMIVPHVLLHTPDVFVQYGLISGIINTIMLTFLFGVPFAYLQRKRDLTSAMIAHGTVVAIRFMFLGLPY